MARQISAKETSPNITLILLGVLVVFVVGVTLHLLRTVLLPFVIAILLSWVLLLRYAGFALSGVVGFASIAWYISGQRKDWRVISKAVVLGLAITYLIIFVFGHLLLVPLPQSQIFG